MSRVLGNPLQTRPYGKWSTLSTASKTIRLINPYEKTPDSVYGCVSKRDLFLKRMTAYLMAIQSAESMLLTSNSKIEKCNQALSTLRPYAEGPDHPEDYSSINFKIAQYEGAIVYARYDITGNQEKIAKLKSNQIRDINESIAYLNSWIAQCTEDLSATIEAEECNKDVQKKLCDSIMQCTAAIQKDMMQLNYFESNA
jgi:hypothetical protein